MPTSFTLPKSCSTVWKRATMLTLQPPVKPFMSLLSPWPHGSVQSVWNLIAWRTLAVGVLVRPYEKPSNAEPPSLKANW